MSVFLFVTPCFSWERPLVQRRYRRARARGRAHWAVEVEAADGEWFLWSRGWEPWMVDTKSLQKRNQRMIYIYIYLSIKTMDLDLTMFVFIEIWRDWWIHVDVPVEVWFHMRYLAKNLRKTRRSRCNDFWKAGAKTTAATWMEVFEGDQLLVDRFKH